MGWVLGKKHFLICFSSMFMNSNSKYLFCLLHWLTTLTSSIWVAPRWNYLLEKEDHFYNYQIQGPAGFPGLQDIVFQNGHWQFYDTSQEKNVIWTERQLLLVQHIGFLHWCHTLCNCVLKCAKFCLAPLPLHFSRTHGEPQEAQGGHCQWQLYWISSILSFGCIILGLCGY